MKRCIVGNMQKIGIALWKVTLSCGCCTELKSVLLPISAVLATLLGAVVGAYFLFDVADEDDKYLFIPVGVLQLICFFLHDWWYLRSKTE